MDSAAEVQWKAIGYRGNNAEDVVGRPIIRTTGDDVLTKVACSGLCRTDLAIMAGKHPRTTPLLVVGHQFWETIADLAPEAPLQLQIGDRVTVNPLLTCGTCGVCPGELPNICRNVELVGIDKGGASAEYVLVGADSVLKTLTHLSDVEGALLVPLAVYADGA